MLSKNNYQERLRKMDDKQERFSIRKFSVGAASVLVGTAILSMQNVQTVRADATTDTEKGTTDVTSKNDEQNKQKAYNQVVSEDQNKASKTTDTTMVGQDSKVASFSASKNEGTFAEASSEDKTSSTTDAQKVESKVATAKATTDTANSVKTASTTSTDQTTSVNTTTFNTNQSSTAALFSASALSESKALAATPRASSATTNAQAKNNNYKLVTSSSELQQAINSGVAGINIDRSIDASNVNLAITNTFAIVGINDAAVLNLGQKSLNNSGNLTLQDITINGAVSGNGTVNIKGNVTSNVNENNSLIKGATADAANAALKDQTSTGTIGTQGTSCASGSSNQNGWTVKGWNYANFSGSKVNVAADANLTINRSAIGDGIHLANNGTVNVADGGQLTINMNTNNDLNTTARYHNAGIFAVGNGNFTTGYKSVVTLNTSIGQGIAMTGMRPYVTDTDVFGGYSARDRGDGSGQINLGQYSTLNFTGRDGVILGNNSNFNVGDSANVHFENKGRGVALDLAANSNINIDDHAVTYFHSVGKTTTNALGNTVGASGSFSGYNYIGVNEGGNITVGKFATFRVILEGRGNNNYDDVVSLDSQNTNTNAAFTSKTGAIVDIRDDNTNFYAELISFPLGASNTRIDIHDPLMLNLQRYSSGGPTTGWMPIGGDMINTTSNQYTANLIYMSGSKGVFSVDGTNYVVYQKIKSDGSKQIWLNVNGVNIPMSGFQTKDIWDNQANPDVSIKGNDLTSGIRANQVHNYDGTPLTGKDAPYYGISTQRASQQIWFPHKTQMEVVGSHTNTIKYVYEDGTPVLDENGNQIVKTQNLNLTRKLTLDITDDKIEEIQNYALTHNADQTLEYIKNAQGVSEDSGWVYTDAQGNTVTDPYATVVSPVEDGQTASIESSNVPGITEGADGTSVTAKLQYKEELVQNGELSNNYKQNGLSAILPDNYETVVVYKKAKEVTNTLKFYDDTTKSYISTVADQTATGKENDDVNFKDGASTVKSLEDQGYKFINVTDGTPDDTNATVLSGDTFSDVDFGKFGKDGKTFVVHLTHKVVPVTPDTPNVPSNSKVSKDDLTKTATRTIHYVENDQNGAELKESTVQTVNYTGTAYVDVVTGQMVNAKADGKDAQGNTTYVVDTDNKKQPSITWTTDNNGKFAQVTPDASIKKGDDTWTTGVKSVDEKNAPDVSTITGKTTNEDVYVPYTLSQKTYTGTKETKTVTRVINYLDNETKQPVSDAVEQTTTLSRTQIKDEKGNVIGYGTVSEDGHSYTLNNDWTIDKNGWVAQVSPDETAKGYKETPHFEDGKDASTVAADTPSVTDPQDVTVNVFYDHDTTPVTPDKPGHGLTHDDLNKDVTRTINYVDTTGAAVNGAPDGKSTYTQTAHFTRTAIVDKVNDKLLGYDINGDGSVDISPDAGDFAWKSTDANLPAVTSKAPSEVGYDSVDTPVVQATTVAYNSEPINVTVTYSKNAQQGSFQIHYIDEDNNNAILHQDTVSDKIGDSVTYSTADQIQLWESKGYVLDQDGYTTQTTVNEDNNGKTYIVSFKHGRKNGTTETLVPTETIHFQYADGTKAADDVHGNAGDFKFTRTPIIDTVTGQIVDPGTWNKESYTFDDGQKNVKVINGYVADKATYGNKTATPTDLNVEDTVTYRKISNIIPVDENGNQIPGTTPVDYKNDPSDPTKVTPDEESPKVPSGWTISPNQPEGVTPNTTTNTAKVTPVDPTKPTNVVYTKDNAPVDKATVIVRYHDDTTNLDLPESFDSGNKEVGTDTGYTQADINKVVQEYEAKGYYYVTTDGTLPTTIPAGGATIVVHLAHNQIPVGPDTPDKHGVDPDQVKKAYTSTLHYQDSEGKTLSPDQQQTSTWTRTVTVDTVTNQIVNGGKYDTNWTLQDANDKYSNFTVPVVEGYVARKTTNNGATVTTVVAGQTKVQQNLEDTVVYDKVGKLVPVGPDGKTPIPDTPTPSNPNLSKEDLQKTITRTIEYKYADGTQAHEPVKQELTFTGKGTIDLVTGNLVTVDEDGNITSQNGKITWNHESQEFEAVPAIDHDGYYISSINQSNSTASVDGQTGAVGTETVTPNSQNGNIVITLTRNPDVPVAAQGSINYIDDTTGQTIESANFSGNVGQKINYTTAGSIKNWEAKGYNLVSNNFKDGEEVFTDGKNAFEVHLVHATTPVTPENPGKPGEPVNPTNPDDPHKYPDNYVPQELAKTVTRDVTYVYADGSQAEAPVHQEVKFTGNGYLDLVTGEYVTVDNNGKITGKGQINWTPESANFDATKSIDTSKYQIVGIKENNTTANVDQTTGVVAGETVTQNSNNSSVVITLANKPAPVVEKGSITVKVHDLTDNVDLPQYGKESGEQEVGTSFTYDKNAVITELINKGYKLVDGGENVPSEVAKGAKTITILVEHDTVPVTPENPGKPGEPINPNDPDGPKWPEGTDENSVKRTGTQTIHYEGAGDKTPSDDVQTFDFTKKMLVDKVTGKIIDSGEWNVTSHTFGYKDTPVIDGYHADKRNAGGSVVTPNDLNKKVVVTYKPNGKIIPTDPSGNPIPNVPTPTYPTDPTDPTKVVPDEPVPDIPGMTPSTPTVTPEDPGKDTPVPYNPVVPAKNQVAQVIYRDVQDGANKQLATSGDLTGKSGSEISYSTADQIKKLINQGYVLKNDGFPAGAVFDNDDSKNQVFYVDFIHGQAPVNPDNPHEGIDPSQYEKTVTEKVHYVGAGDKTPADNVQNSKWTRTLTIDTVTGKVVENGQYTTDWSIAKGEKTVYDQVSTPVIDGYHADKREVPATAVTQDDIEVTVTYKPNGKIIPTDPSSNPIPNVPNPTYPTDPTDPTKVVPDQPVPEVPGMTPSTPTVTPEDPGKDTPVPYNPVKNPDKVTTVEGKQIVHFVDGDNGNTPLRDPNTQTHEFKITNGVPDESSHTFTLVDVPVIPGYVAEVKSAGGKTVTPDTPLAEVTVVYHKVGKIVPVDPNGNPIPNVPTPSYTNDPTDPTKVVPNEPVPAITGKTPDKTSVTPVDPTKDTPVVYKNNEVPATPNSQKAVVNFIDVNTGKLIKTSGILSGRPGEDINKLYSSAEVIKQLEEAGYEVVYNAFDGDGVTKYFDDDDNTTQQFTVALKLKEKAKTPYPVVPAPETPAKEPEAPAEKVSRPEQPVKQNVSVPTPQKPVEKKTNNKKEVLPQTGADNNEAASILGAVATAIGMTSLIGAKRRKKDDK
ncbi:YSIRK-type signal peptide-containing protein [Lactobacillus gasseri]|nr:YSIRK-type signal peptide-containing protein [Lactobacillus gasseri]